MTPCADLDTTTITPKIVGSQNVNELQIASPLDMAQGGGNTPIILHK